MDKETLGKSLLEAAYLEGDFVLRSGKRSKYYLDKYLFETEPRVLRGIVFEMAVMMREQLAAGCEYERLAAPELGGVVLGAGLSLELGIPLLLVRKESKEYGTTKQIEGRFEPGETGGDHRGHRHLGRGGHHGGGGPAGGGSGGPGPLLRGRPGRGRRGGRGRGAGSTLRPLFTSSELGIAPKP